MIIKITTKKPIRPGGRHNVMECHSAAYRQAGILSPKHVRYRGVALVWAAILLLLMILVIGLSLDTAKLAHNVHELQNAADAAALAGAQIVKVELPSVTRQRTHDLGFANTAEHLAVTLLKTAQPELFPYPTDWDDPCQVTAYEAAMAPLDIVIGRWVRYNHTFVPTYDAPNAVQVFARRNEDPNDPNATAPALSLMFGPIAKVYTADAARMAVAWDYTSGGAGLICLDPNAEPGLYLSGTADLDIDYGGIHINSTASGHNSSDGSWISGGALVDAGFINVVGGIDPPPEDDAWESLFMGGNDGVNGFSVSDESTFPEPQHIPDPLAAMMLLLEDPYVVTPGDHMDLPALIDGTFPIHNIPTVGGTGTEVTLAPGYYPNGISLSNGDTVILQPGPGPGPGPGLASADNIFIFGGGTDKNNSDVGLYMTGGTLIGKGVTCYVTQTFPEPADGPVCGLIRLNGGEVNLWSPGDWANKEDGLTPDDPIYQERVNGLNGITIWQDPTMIVPKTGLPPEAHLNGNSEFIISGTLYFPDTIHVTIEGNLGEAGNQILCGSMDVLGKAVISMNYDGRNQPGLSNRCCLVK